jgi:nicotinamidase-related amidase
MLLDPSDSTLVLVDYQQRLMPAIADATAVLLNAERLARLATLFEVPILATEQNPTGLGPTVASLRGLLPSVMTKAAFGASAELMPRLRPSAVATRGNARSLPRHLQKPVEAAPVRGSVVLAGCEAHVCVLQTALQLLDEEFDVWVVTDACGSRTDRNRDAAFDRLAGAGCELVTTEMVAFEWLGDSRHPRFKEALALIK